MVALHAAWAFASSLILASLSFLIHRQKTASPTIKIVKSSLILFISLLSLSMMFEAANNLFEAAGNDLYELLTLKAFYAVSFIAVIFLINAFSVPLSFPHVKSQMELFKSEFSKLEMASFFNILALAMAFITFLPDSVLLSEGAFSSWYYSLLIAFTVSLIIVFYSYFCRHMATTRRKKSMVAICLGFTGLVNLHFFHHPIEYALPTGLELIYLCVVSTALASTLILTVLREKVTFDQFFLRYDISNITANESELKDAFSKTLGLSHQQLEGRRILLEFDPTSNYEKAIKDFAAEASANIGTTVLFTRKESPVYSAINTQATVRFLLTPLISVPATGASENEMLLPADNTPLILESLFRTLKTYSASGSIFMVFDSLSDLILTIGFEKTYSFLRYVMDLLASTKVTALLLLNSSAHDPKIVSSLRGLFSSQITYGKEGIRAVK